MPLKLKKIIEKTSQSIKIKVLGVLLILIMLYALNSFFNVFYNHEKEKISSFNTTINSIQILLLKDVNTVNNFLSTEINDNIFIATGSSYLIEEHNIYISGAKSGINTILTSDVIQKFDIEKNLEYELNSINEFDSCFNDIVIYASKNAGKSNKSQISKLETLKMKILDEFSYIEENTRKRNIEISKNLNLLLLYTGSGFILIGIIVSIFISNRTTKRILALSGFISKFVSSKFTYNQEYTTKKGKDEIGELIENFIRMRNEVLNQIENLEEKVQERTNEISIQKEIVIDKNHIIEKQNKDMLDSIAYAKKIQEAFLPNLSTIKDIFEECFIFWKPKDVISGDFYWFKNFKKRNITVLAVADCTGHGVPGGVMSMLGNSLLNEIVLRKKIFDSGRILNTLRERLIETLNPEGNENDSSDGMDIGIIVFDNEKKTIQFSGANRPLYLIRDKSIQRIKGDSMPIGRHTNENKPFSTHIISIEKNDSFYMLSDGFVDQYGGKLDRKYMTKRFENLLLDNHAKSMTVQSELLEKEFVEWKENKVQTDDVLVIGFRIKELENINPGSQISKKKDKKKDFYEYN